MTERLDWDITDGLRKFHEMGRSERDHLLAIQILGGSASGTDIRVVVEDLRGETVNNGVVYPTLDNLVTYDLVERGSIDGRTNEYALTDEGEDTLKMGMVAFSRRVTVGDQSK
jgi:DNA-binding PadR family transcriptional regulator